MKALTNSKTNGVIIAVSFLLAVSCSYVHANLIKEGSLKLEVVPSSVKIFSVRAYQEGYLIKVLGSVFNQNCDAEAIDGHVDIALFSADKKLLQTISINYAGKKAPSKVRGGHHHDKHFNREFTAAIPTVPPQGAVIKIAFHNIPLDGAALTDCGQNMAAI